MAWRKLKHNKATQIARSLIFVDCETKSIDDTEDNTGRHKLWFGIARSGRFVNERGTTNWGRQDYCRFETAEEFWTFARSKARKRETTWIYAHNAGFDFIILGLLNKLADGSLKISKPRKSRNRHTKRTEVYGLLMLEDPPTVIGVEDNDGCRYVLCDTLNYWRIALASLGTSVGLDKIDFPDADASATEWNRYCNRDVEVIERAITQLIAWWRDMDLGNWRWTAPGLAMSAFRHKFMKHDIVFHDEMSVRALERASYFGGQLEAYKIGDISEPVFQYDVVSLYPSVMTGNLYPICLEEWDVHRGLSDACPFVEPLHAIAEVEVNTSRDTFPVRNSDGVCYANGRGTITLAGPELRYAIDNGYVRRFGKYAIYSMAPIFTDYVTFFYELKNLYESEGKQVQRNFVKLLLNSLYGKFAQRGGRWQYNPERLPLWDFGLFYEHNPFKGEYTKHLGLFDVTFDWKPKQEIELAAPSIASFVTSYARQHMRKLRQVAGVGNYFYMSTDSLLVNQQGRTNFEEYGGIVGRDLGQLKLEVEADEAWIGGLHYYRIGPKLIEGSKKSSAETLGEGIWSELQFDSLLSVIQRSGTNTEDRDAIKINRVTKHRSNEYKKGDVLHDGTIRPYTFEQVTRTA